MKKTQELPCYWGDSDRMRCGTTLGYNTSSDSWTNFSATERYAWGKAHATVQFPINGYVGSQSFDSGRRPLPWFNSLTNIKLQAVNYPYCKVSEDYRRPTSLYEHPYFRYTMPYYSGQVNLLEPVSWSSCDAAQRRAWWEMQPRFEGEVEGLNFLFELKDFRSIVKHAARFDYKGLVKNVSNARTVVKRSLRDAKQRIKAGISKPLDTTLAALDYSTIKLAEARLIKEFAIDPTVSDCLAIHEQLATLVEEVQQEFFDRGKDVQSRHYSEQLSSEFVGSSTIGYGNSYMWTTGLCLQSVFTATLQYRYDYAMRDLGDALKMYYGLNLNAEVVWNALPFSFLFDYFYKVGNALHAMRTDPNVVLNVNQYCESLLTSLSYGVHFNHDPRNLVMYCPSASKMLLGLDATCFAGVQGTHYQRKVTVPNKGTALPRVSTPSGGQIKNMLALARVFW